MSAIGTPARVGSPSGRAGEAHEAAHALRHQVIAGARRIGAGLAEAGDRAIDQTRVVGREAFIVEAELLEPADLEVLEQHVGARRELLDDALAFRRLEVELDRALAAIGAMEIGRAQMAAVGCRYEGRAPRTRVVAGTLALDLDHVGAEVGEDLPRPRPRQNAGKLEDTHTAKGTRHRKLLGNRAANGRARKTTADRSQTAAKTAVCVARRHGLVHSRSPGR